MIPIGKRLDRRTLLRGAGGAALALPLLDAMLPRRHAHAQAATTRFLVYFTPGGTEINDWRPNGADTSFTFKAMNQPLEKHKQHLLVIDGLNYTIASDPANNGHAHTRGMGGFLTGNVVPAGSYNTNGGNAGFVQATSLDQFLAGRLAGDRKFRSLEMAVRWPSDGTDGLQVHPWNTIVYSAPGRPVPPRTVPRAIFDSLFKDLGGAGDAERLRSKSVLDAVLEEYRLLQGKLGGLDRQKVDAHLSAIRTLEQTIAAGTAACTVPDFGNELDLPSAAGSDKGGDGFVDSAKDMAIPRTGRLMIDMMVMAMACDLTRVGTIQWADSQANYSLPWLGLNDTHHGYQHDRGYNPEAIRKIMNWHATQFAYLLDKMIAVQEAGGTLLDNTVILWGTEIRHPNDHSQDNVPFMIAGKGGGYFKPGRYVRASGRAHNDVLVSVQNAFGVPDASYGKPGYAKGPIPGLT